MRRLALAIALAVGVGAVGLAPAAPPTAAPPTAAAAPVPAAPALDSPHGASIGELDCSACHDPSGWDLMAGDGGGFDHARTGFPLIGAHATTACAGCHAGKKTPPTACTGCHTDAHVRRLGRECAECHGSMSWTDTRTRARHRQTRLPLTGKHALLDCTACHRKQKDRSFAAVPADCFSCHAQDYRGVPHPDHAADPAVFTRDCGRCHQASAWKPAYADPALLGSDSAMALRHEALFPLRTGPHRGATCDACHASSRRPSAVSCTGCHVHDGATLRRQHGRRAVMGGAASCLGCHPGGRAR